MEGIYREMRLITLRQPASTPCSSQEPQVCPTIKNETGICWIWLGEAIDVEYLTNCGRGLWGVVRMLRDRDICRELHSPSHDNVKFGMSHKLLYQVRTWNFGDI